MANETYLPAVLSTGIGTTLVLLFTLPNIWHLARIFGSSKKRNGPIALQDVFQDEDGTATEESQAAFSDRVPRTVLNLATLLGFGISLGSAVLSIVWRSSIASTWLVSTWVNTAAWALLMIRALYISSERSSTERFTAGAHGAICATILVIALCIQSIFSIVPPEQRHVEPKHVQLALSLTQTFFAVIVFAASMSLPRRPAVFLENGKPVDNQFTVSLFNRSTFGWNSAFLDISARKLVQLDDLPRPAYENRASFRQQAFNYKLYPGSLWKAIYFAHSTTFVTQFLLMIFEALLGFAPQLSLFRILSLLELRTNGQDIGYEIWIWVLFQGLSFVVLAWVEAWTIWISQTRLSQPIRAELGATIFQKAMRRKDVKEIKKVATAVPEDTERNASTTSNPDPGKQDSTQKANEPEAKLKQSTINLMNADARRLAEFGSIVRAFPDATMNLAVSLAFLFVIIGWKPLLVGIVAFLLVIPVNSWSTRKLAAIQDKMMAVGDEKTETASEALGSLRQIKFSALERQWQAKIGEVRNRELDLIWWSYVMDAFVEFSWIAGPLLLSTVSLSVFAYTNKGLPPSVAFTALEVFFSLNGALSSIPELVTIGSAAWISHGRVQKYLESPEVEEHINDGKTVCFEDASLAWPVDDLDVADNDRFVLRNVNAYFPAGELSVISGATGCGKSLMLSSIIGESDLLNGTLSVPRPLPAHQRYDHKATAKDWILPSTIAFVAQIPWIENATIKDNILFGLPLDQTRYQKTLWACALTQDLEMLSDGDRTEIGPKGINLSGGQRWRVTLARALYSRAGILVLDDIFSAVDTHVGKWIFEKALTGELGRGRTRILATHHVAICRSRTAYVVQLGNGTVEHAGLVEELGQSGELTKILEFDGAGTENADGQGSAGDGQDASLANGEMPAAENGAESQPKKFVQDEHREEGRITSKVYSEWARAAGGLVLWTSVLMLFVMSQVTEMGRWYWVKIWSGTYEEQSAQNALTAPTSAVFNATSLEQTGPITTNFQEHTNFGFYIGLYVALSFADGLFSTFRVLAVNLASIKGSRNLFNKMLYVMLNMPLRWIDTTPVGRMLNRVTGDINNIESALGGQFSATFANGLFLIATVVATLFASPYVLIFGAVFFAIAMYFARYYLAAAREAKRLQSVSRSPILELLGSALDGIATIRASDNAQTYISRMWDRIDDFTVADWALILNTRWFAFRQSVIGAAFTFAVAVLIISISSIDAALAGFVLSFASSFTSAISNTLRAWSSFELNMNATERVLEYSSLAIEDQGGIEVPAAWPSEGRVEVADLEVAYADDLPPVLKDLSFRAEAGQRIGIVGRTGAGKSSLALALFRFLEARQGSIVIDGIDISQIKVSDLRSRLAIIPQDPKIFSGTIRSNLDPFDQFIDAELKNALQRVHLTTADSPAPTAETNTSIFTTLSSPISSSGLNLSQGQRQLLCLARALLARSKIMVLDEATSAVDMDTDAKIQRSIREEFQGSTLLVIAHRLSTVADFDKVLVMADGRAVEFGAPAELLGVEGGAFKAMVGDSGEREGLEKLIRGED